MATDPIDDSGATAASAPGSTGLESFDELKALALETVRRLAGDDWTNFNESDPGITILELLCYAITDLGYRAALPIEDLIAGRNGDIDLAARQLFPAGQILISGAVTTGDYRRILLDEFEELINCWVRVQPDGPLTPPSMRGVRGRLGVALSVVPGTDARLIDRVRDFLEQHRNLCERFDEIAFAPDLEVTLTGSLIVDRSLEASSATDDVRQCAQAALTPPVRFVARTEIEGPRLRHGAIPDSELHPPLEPLTAQQLVEHAVTHAPGVLALGADFKVVAASPPAAAWAWTYRVGSAQLTFVDERGQTLTGAAGAESVAASTPFALPTRILPPSPPPPAPPAPRAGMDVARYYSIQASLPRIYGLGQHRLDDGLPAARRGEIRQLQGYLLHFEQLLANFLAQLAHAGLLLSAVPQERTYYCQPLYDVPGCAPLLDGADVDAGASSADTRDRWTAFVAKPANMYLDGLSSATENAEEFDHRRRRFLDHLLARFGESFPIRDRHTFETIENKEQFLAAYAGLSLRRTSGLVAPRSAGESQREPGLASALKILLRPGGRAEELIHHSVETSLYLLESVLWLPLETEAPAAAPAGDVLVVPARLFDLQMLLVMGNWTMWPEVTDGFKQYVQDLAESRSPAHLMLHGLWLSDGDMTAFRDRYQAWLDDGCRPLVLCQAPSAVGEGEVAVLAGTPAGLLVRFLMDRWPGGAWPPGASSPFAPSR